MPLPRPRWGFWKGMLAGVAIEIPALTGAVWALAQLGIGNAEVPVMRIMRLTTVFAGVAAIFTAGGVGRLAAYASSERSGGGRRRAVFVAARAHAVASAGLVLIAALPHGQLPDRSLVWLAFPAAGAVVGAACGAVIGLVCSGPAPVDLADVWSLARLPSAALLSWLDPRELVRLGAAVRQRTSHLFEGMFDPAPPPPASSEPSPPASSPPPRDPE